MRPGDGGFIDGIQTVPKWVSPNWTYDPLTGLWNPNPSMGTDIISDPAFDNAAAWGTVTDFTVAGGVLTKVAGVASRDIYNNGTPPGLNSVIGTWYRGQCDVTRSAGTLYFGIGSSPGPNITATGSYAFTCRATTAGKSFLHGYNTAAGTFDNFHGYTLSLTELIARVFTGRQNVAVSAIIPVNFQAGVMARGTNDLSSYLLGWYDRSAGKITLDAIYGGVVHNLIAATSATYGDNYEVEIRWAGADTAQLWYHGVQIGADQDVSAVPMGNYSGMFATDTSVKVNFFFSGGFMNGFMNPNFM